MAEQHCPDDCECKQNYELGEDVTRVARPRKRVGAVVSIRFSAEEMDTILTAAERQGLKISTLIKRAAVAASEARISLGDVTASPSVTFFPTTRTGTW